MNKLMIIVLIFSIFTACNNSKPKQAENITTADMSGIAKIHKVKVDEVIQTSNYTYLGVYENQQSFWIAISKQDVEVGEEIIYMGSSATEMVNFHSKELDRTFESILFISQVSKENGAVAGNPHQMMGQTPHTGRKIEPELQNEKIEVAEGGISIAELFANKLKYKDSKVKIRGRVVKVNMQIMGRNWVHLQDGTKNGEEYDLTFTTQETVNLDDVVTFQGQVSIDKDFTSGYFYPVIIEDAKLVK